MIQLATTEKLHPFDPQFPAVATRSMAIAIAAGAIALLAARFPDPVALPVIALTATGSIWFAIRFALPYADRASLGKTGRRLIMTDTPVRIAIYDLDRTVLRKPTFTLFLLWAAWRDTPWRLLTLPALLLLFAGAGLGIYKRDTFKPAAIRLMLGRRISAVRAADLAQHFAAWRVPAD
eukprot:gene11880-15118_t